MSNDYPPGHPAGTDEFMSVGEVTSGHGLGNAGVLGTQPRAMEESTQPTNEHATTGATVAIGPTVLIAVDADQMSERVVRTAHRLFGESATYLAINVGHGPYSEMRWAYVWPVGGASAWPPFPSVDHLAEVGAGNALTRAAALAQSLTHDAGLDQAEPIGDVGDPTSAIIRAAHHHQASVVVIGADERSWLSRLVDGSVERELLHDADFAVLVVAADRPAERT
ncbi:MAG: universal stress protein [Ilumatobacteraceae bacterium]